MNALRILEDQIKNRLPAQINKGFDWASSIPAPFGASGWVALRAPHPDVFLGGERIVERGVAILFNRFAATFGTLACGTNIVPYTSTITRLMQEDGAGEEAAYYPRLVLALVAKGLSNYASVLGPYLFLVDDDPIAMPISQMHIWALGEAARMNLTCINAGGAWPDTAEDAEEVLRLTQEENLVVTESENPYANVFVTDYESTFAPSEKLPKRK